MAAALLPSLASAEEVSKQACVDSHVKAQAQRLQGRLVEAQQSLLTCANEGCPEIVQKDCVKWLEELQGQLPTVIFEAFDEEGALRDVTVKHEGRVLASSLDGMAVQIDPGQYDLVFETPEGRTRSLRVLVRQGDRNRPLAVDFAEQQRQVDDWVLRVPRAARVSGAVTVVATGVALGFGASAVIRQSNAVKSCAPACDERVSRRIAARAAVADVAGGIAVVSGVVTTVFIARASGRERAALREHAGFVPVVGWEPGTGFLAIEGVF